MQKEEKAQIQEASSLLFGKFLVILVYRLRVFGTHSLETLINSYYFLDYSAA